MYAFFETVIESNCRDVRIVL